MNWEFIGKYLPMYEKAALLTVKIGIIGILFAILVGLICAAVQYYKVPVLRWIVAVYVELSRNTPLLVQLFFIYYGFPKIGIRMSAELCGVVGLAFLGGSYMAEAFRSGLEAVEPIQNESAISLGMNSGHDPIPNPSLGEGLGAAVRQNRSFRPSEQNIITIHSQFPGRKMMSFDESSVSGISRPRSSV